MFSINPNIGQVNNMGFMNKQFLLFIEKEIQPSF